MNAVENSNNGGPGDIDLVAVEKGLADLLDDQDFQKINQRLGRFNLFEAINSIRGELRHSNFLAFILSPARPHELGSRLLERILRTLVAKVPKDQRTISVLEIALADLDSSLVERERDNIDILLEIPSIPLVVAIENKIDAGESQGQLSRYKEIIGQKFPNYRKLFILLTPSGMAATHPDYISFSYGELAALVEIYLDEQQDALRTDTKLILRHYVEMLRRHIVDDEKLRVLARQLYERYREAFDFIIDSRPQPDSLLEPLRGDVEGNPALIMDKPGSGLLRFAHTNWLNIRELNSCPLERWTRSGRNLLFELRAHRGSGRVTLSLILGPSENIGPASGNELRRHVYSEASKQPDVFRGLVKGMGQHTSTIFLRELLSARVSDELDEDEKRGALKNAWDEFVERDLASLDVKVRQFADSFVKYVREVYARS